MVATVQNTHSNAVLLSYMMLPEILVFSGVFFLASKGFPLHGQVNGSVLWVIKVSPRNIYYTLYAQAKLVMFKYYQTPPKLHQISGKNQVRCITNPWGFFPFFFSESFFYSCHDGKKKKHNIHSPPRPDSSLCEFLTNRRVFLFFYFLRSLL